MIANARMYSVSAQAAQAWRNLLSLIIDRAGLPITVIDHSPPEPIEHLWEQPALAGVFMCGLPFSQARPQPLLVAAPVPSPAQFAGQALYWSEFVVLQESSYRSVTDTFRGRLALTVPSSQSGYGAVLDYFKAADSGPPGLRGPLFAEVIAPTVTPLGAMTAVVSGAADIAPIDSYAFALLHTYRPELTARLRVVGRTESLPIPPLVASRDATSTNLVEALAAAFAQAHQQRAAKPLMRQLLLHRFARPEPEAYGVLADRFASATEYWKGRRLANVIHPAFAR